MYINIIHKIPIIPIIYYHHIVKSLLHPIVYIFIIICSGNSGNNYHYNTVIFYNCNQSVISVFLNQYISSRISPNVSLFQKLYSMIQDVQIFMT